MSILRDNATRYGLVSQILHWGLAGLIIFTFISGQVFEDAARAEKAELMNRHATLAILLMAFWWCVPCGEHRNQIPMK